MPSHTHPNGDAQSRTMMKTSRSGKPDRVPFRARMPVIRKARFHPFFAILRSGLAIRRENA